MINKKGITLIELLIAISLMSIIIIAATTFQLYALNVFKTLRTQTQISNDVPFIMEHIKKNFGEALDVNFESENNRGFSISTLNQPYRVLLDIRQDPNMTYSNPADDIIVEYVAEAINNKSDYSDGCRVRYGRKGDTLSNMMILGIVDKLYFSKYNSSNLPSAYLLTGATVRNIFTCNIAARKDMTKPEGPDNPKVALQSTFIARMMSAQE